MKSRCAGGFLALGGLISLLGCGDLAQAQRYPNHPPRVGAYTKVGVDGNVMKAAQFAVKTQAMKESVKLQLISVSDAETQVVAGLNYHFTVTATRGGKQQAADVIVYQNLNQAYSMISWRWLQ